MTLQRKRADNMWKERFKLYLIIITSGLLYLALFARSEPVCYTRKVLDARNAEVKITDCNGDADKICKRFASREDVTMTDVLNSPCYNPEEYSSTPEGSTQKNDPQECNKCNEWNGKEYKFISTEQSWTDSRQLCETYGAHLVTIENEEENEFVHNIVLQLHCSDHPCLAWIGLHDLVIEGMWEWSDRTVATYRNWEERQPDSGKGENCALIDYRNNGKWDDYPCSHHHHGVCERNKPLK